MRRKKIYLCRHGETAWTVTGQHTGKTDLPLTAKGREETAKLRKRIQGIPFIKIFSSPRLRAQESAEGLGAEIEPLLAEWDYGDYEGLTTEEIFKKNPRWNLFQQGAPGGETPRQIGMRADQFLQKIELLEGPVAIVSHGHFLRVLAARFLGFPIEAGSHFLLSTASLSILGFEREERVVLLWNETN